MRDEEIYDRMEWAARWENQNGRKVLLVTEKISVPVPIIVTSSSGRMAKRIDKEIQEREVIVNDPVEKARIIKKFDLREE